MQGITLKKNTEAKENKCPLQVGQFIYHLTFLFMDMLV